MLAGFYRGWVDQVISRLMDFLMAFPALIFMIAILSSLPAGNRPVLLVVVISAFGWPYLARVIRGQTMTLANREFVEAARASGAKDAQVGVPGDPAEPARLDHRDDDAGRCPATSAPRPGCRSSASASPRRPRPGAR